jgi:hypothetical protein
LQAQQAIINHGCKAEEYMSNGKRVFAIVNSRTGSRIINTSEEKSFDDMCKRLKWL